MTVASDLYEKNRVYRVRQKYRVAEDSEKGMEVLIRFASPNDMKADVTLMPHTQYALAIGAFDLSALEIVPSPQDVFEKELNAAGLGAVLESTNGGSVRYVKIPSGKWVTTDQFSHPARDFHHKNYELIHRGMES